MVPFENVHEKNILVSNHCFKESFSHYQTEKFMQFDDFLVFPFCFSFLVGGGLVYCLLKVTRLALVYKLTTINLQYIKNSSCILIKLASDNVSIALGWTYSSEGAFG